jgi:hypothetical protein
MDKIQYNQLLSELKTLLDKCNLSQDYLSNLDLLNSNIKMLIGKKHELYPRIREIVGRLLHVPISEK